ncbi:MAG TPA: RNA-binding S4 domain-containing protein [bacterium]|nr:RNA-binding S4 domain-containing protein [bacterium]
MQIQTESITLGAFLKWAGAAATGGVAKQLIEQDGVIVNGVVERRRGRQLRDGDRVRIGAAEFVVRYQP